MSDEKTKSRKGRSQNVMVTEQELPAVQLGVEVLTDNGQLELQKPPEKPFTIKKCFSVGPRDLWKSLRKSFQSEKCRRARRLSSASIARLDSPEPINRRVLRVRRS